MMKADLKKINLDYQNINCFLHQSNQTSFQFENI